MPHDLLLLHGHGKGLIQPQSARRLRQTDAAAKNEKMLEHSSQTTYKVRAYTVGAVGFLTQADHYEDFLLQSTAGLEEFAKELAVSGFQHPNKARWIMPSAIVWVEVA